MMYNRRELRRLWEVEVYNGHPDDPDTTTRIETLVAWNAVDAIRRAGGEVARPPKQLFFVTWPDSQNPEVYRIDSPKVGPVGAPVKPTIAIEEADWGPDKSAAEIAMEAAGEAHQLRDEALHSPPVVASSDKPTARRKVPKQKP